MLSSNCGKGIVTITLLPNPAHGQATLQVTGSAEAFYINIYNMAGQPVYQTRANAKVSLPVDKWTAGVYNVIVTDEQKNMLYQQKLVVQ